MLGISIPSDNTVGIPFGQDSRVVLWRLLY